MPELSRQGVGVNQRINDRKEHSFDESAIARLRGTQCFSVGFVSKALNFISYFPQCFTKIMSPSPSEEIFDNQ